MSSRIDLDDLDREIIKLLMLNSRMSYRKIAERLGVSPATVLVRLRKLRKKGVIRGFTVDIDPEKLGFSVQAYMLIKTDPKKTRNVLIRLSKMDNIVELCEVTGDYHLLLKVWAEDQKALANIIDQVRLVDGVVDTNTMLVLRSVKRVTMLV
ncbi:Lrp/AsnC family transcriptional regulator [Desulfurococcaceae archaeon MEX13E-LK6-19]|nr:Lrp/AsnC family transcriptional regulator [Desulfurococcaceae archaeon MEX13E-LK6-19]